MAQDPPEKKKESDQPTYEDQPMPILKDEDKDAQDKK